MPTQPQPVFDKVQDGDESWAGVNMRRAPEDLAPGELAYGENIRCRNGKPVTRPGVLKPVWCHRVDGNGKVMGWGTPYGAGIFRDPDGRGWHFLACASGVYQFCENTVLRVAPLPTGVKVTGPCTFVQAFDKLYLFRGRDFPVLVLSRTDIGFLDLVAHWNAQSYVFGDRVLYGTWKTPSAGAVTRSGTTVTVVLTSHGYKTGQDVTVAGATQTEYNGRFNVTRIDQDTFSYQFAGSAAATATGTVKVSRQWDLWEVTDKGGVISTDIPGVSSKWTRRYDKLPNADNALFVQNRLLVPTAFAPGDNGYDATSDYVKKDYIAAMDYLDDSRFQWFNQFRINQGSDDEIVDLAKFSDDAVIAFKDRSWGILSGIGDDMVNTLRLDMQGREEGLVAPRAWARAGADLLFLAGRRGVMSIRQTEQGKFMGVNLPFSQDMDPAIARVNWVAARGCARMDYWDNRLYVAVPLDSSPVNNAVLVYDFITQKWQGIDTGSALCVQEFWHGEMAGVDRLFFLGTDGYVNVMEETDCGDRVPDAAAANGLGWEEIESTARTRAYFGDMDEWMRTYDARMILETWNPRYSVNLIFGGIGRTKALVSDRTRDRTQYARPFNRPAWDETNINDDHGLPGREDYSVRLNASPGLYLNFYGIALNLWQEALEDFRLPFGQGHMVQFELTNTQGGLRMVSVRLAAKRGRGARGRIQG